MTPFVLSALPGLAAIGLWALRDTERFVLYAVLSAMVLSPLTLFQPGGAQVALVDVLLIVAVCASAVAVAAGERRMLYLRGNPLLPALVAFLTINALSLGWTVDIKATGKMLVQMVEIVLVFPILFASLPTSIRSIRSGMVVFVVASSALAILAFTAAAPQLARGEFNAVDLGFGLGNKNAAGSCIAAGFVIGYVLLLGPAHGRQRWVLQACLGIEVLGMVATLSRGSILGAVTAIVLASLMLKRARIVTGATVLIVAVGYFAVVAPQAADKIEAQEGAYSSDIVRVYSFQHAVEKIQARPILGTGSGTYADYIAEVQIVLPDPNNMFLLTWAEIGVFGLAALIFLLVRFARVWWRLASLTPETAVVGVTAGAVAVSRLVHFQFDVTWTRGTTSLCFAAIGLMLAVDRLSRQGGSFAPEQERVTANHGTGDSVPVRRRSLRPESLLQLKSPLERWDEVPGEGKPRREVADVGRGDRRGASSSDAPISPKEPFPRWDDAPNGQRVKTTSRSSTNSDNGDDR